MGEDQAALEHRLSWDGAFTTYKSGIRPHSVEFWDDPLPDSELTETPFADYWLWRDGIEGGASYELDNKPWEIPPSSREALYPWLYGNALTVYCARLRRYRERRTE